MSRPSFAIYLGILVGLVAGVPSAHAADTARVKNLKVLAAIYRGAPDDKNRLTDAQIAQCENGLELGRLFYFRNSRARLNVTFEFRVIDTPAPNNDGPTMDHINADLLQRGVKPGDFDGLIATGVGFKGNFGGFTVLGDAGGCFGIGGHGGVGYPGFAEDVGYGWAWIFAHEFQHALDLVIVEQSGLKMLHAHPYADKSEPFFQGFYQGGEHWDWIACTLREFDDYLSIKGVRNDFFECPDADGDGLPDDDARLPADEKRFGSDSSKKDTDGDGLDDLGEFAADIYTGSDPTKPDTDGDGIKDGEDEYPCVAIRPTIEWRADGMFLDSVAARNDEGGKCYVTASWSEASLDLRLVGPRKFTARIKIDGSAANGFWEGGDTYVIKVSPGEGINPGKPKVEFAGLGLKGEVPGVFAEAWSEKPDEFKYVLKLPAKLGQGVSKEINYGGVKERGDVADGLTLVPGRAIGFNFIYEFDGGKQAVLTPNHRMYAARLVKDDTATSLVPLLRGPAATNAASIVGQVLAVAGDARVEVVAGDEVVGARVGPGPVRLVGLTTDGTYELVAKASGKTSHPIQMEVDRTAAAPLLKQGGTGKLSATCEPGAAVELWWGIEGVPVAPLAGATADGQGAVAFDVPQQGLLPGWTASAYLGMFETPVYIDAWDKIDRYFQGGAPDKRLPPDGFSYRCDGLLQVDAAGRWTFELETDDGSRLYVDDELVINHWGHHEMRTKRVTLPLSAGLHRLHIDYYELDGWAGLRFRGGTEGQKPGYELPVVRAPIPVEQMQFFAVQTDRLGNRSLFGPAAQ